MPNRFIKESCRSSKNLDRLTDFEERVFWRLITTADDFGRFQACPELVRANCFPYRSYSLRQIEKTLRGLQAQSLIQLYTVGDRQYGEFVTWEKHQGKPRSLKSKYPNKLDSFLQAGESRSEQITCRNNNHALPTDTDTDTDTNSSLNSSSDFEQFWESYPKKKGKKAAVKAWKQAKDRPSLDVILQAIDKQKQSDDWLKENGQFIPHPTTWLNQGRWADEVQAKRPSLMQEFLARGEQHDGSRTVLQGLADAHYAAVGKTVSRSDGID